MLDRPTKYLLALAALFLIALAFSAHAQAPSIQRGTLDIGVGANTNEIKATDDNGVRVFDNAGLGITVSDGGNVTFGGDAIFEGGELSIYDSSGPRINSTNESFLFIESHGGVTVDLDDNNNSSEQFQVRNGSSTTVFSLTESGDMTLIGTNIWFDGTTRRGVTDSANSVFFGIDNDSEIEVRNAVIYTRLGGYKTEMTTTAFSPYTDSGMALGTSSKAWSELYVDTVIFQADSTNYKNTYSVQGTCTSTPDSIAVTYPYSSGAVTGTMELTVTMVDDDTVDEHASFRNAYMVRLPTNSVADLGNIWNNDTSGILEVVVSYAANGFLIEIDNDADGADVVNYIADIEVSWVVQ